MDNTLCLIGNLTADPVLQYAASGSARCKGTVAVNRRWQNRQTNEWQEEVSFVDFTIFGEMAEYVCESLAKGARIILQGRLKQESWEDKTTGDKRSKLAMAVDEIGPSLRWATAVVSRIERQQGDSQPSRREEAHAARGQQGGYEESPFG